VRNLPKIGRAMAQAMAAFTGIGQAAIKAAMAMEEMAAKVQALFRLTELQVCRLEARMQVRAGLDPAYSQSPDALVQDLLSNPLASGSMVLRASHRARLAAAALRGWAESHADEPVQVAWHRKMAGTYLQVGVA
jgi:hypothetical protein